MRTLKVCATLTVLGVLIGCGSGIKGRSLEELASSSSVSQEYQINAGDTLSVKVWGESSLSGDVLVREDGRFTMALVGDIEAQGKTVTQISEVVKTKLKAFIPATSVSVSVVQTAPIRYYLNGLFIKPGEYRSEGQITLLQAISTGGGFAPFANESSLVLIRKTPEGELRYELDYNLVIEGREPNPVLRNGDIITVR